MENWKFYKFIQMTDCNWLYKNIDNFKSVRCTQYSPGMGGVLIFYYKIGRLSRSFYVRDADCLNEFVIFFNQLLNNK